jgi:hypothetical protein
MQATLAGALRERRPQVRRHWETLLRVEPIGSPLGHPDTLIHLLDWTLDEIYAALDQPLTRQRLAHRPSQHEPAVHCACQGNPLLGYFAAGEQAMREALILSQATLAELDPLERDASFAELNLVLAEISRREIEAFCNVCSRREASLATGLASGGKAAQRGDSL